MSDYSHRQRGAASARSPKTFKKGGEEPGLQSRSWEGPFKLMAWRSPNSRWCSRCRQRLAHGCSGSTRKALHTEAAHGHPGPFRFVRRASSSAELTDLGLGANLEDQAKTLRCQVSPANTAVYNVQSSQGLKGLVIGVSPRGAKQVPPTRQTAGYLAGATVDALVQLRDRFGNNRTSSSATLLFQAPLLGTCVRLNALSTAGFCSFFLAGAVWAKHPRFHRQQ